MTVSVEAIHMTRSQERTNRNLTYNNTKCYIAKYKRKLGLRDVV